MRRRHDRRRPTPHVSITRPGDADAAELGHHEEYPTHRGRPRSRPVKEVSPVTLKTPGSHTARLGLTSGSRPARDRTRPVGSRRASGRRRRRWQGRQDVHEERTPEWRSTTPGPGPRPGPGACRASSSPTPSRSSTTTSAAPRRASSVRLSAPDGFSVSLPTDTLSLGASQTGYLSAHVTSPASAADGNYALTATVVRAGTSSPTGSHTSYYKVYSADSTAPTLFWADPRPGIERHRQVVHHVRLGPRRPRRPEARAEPRRLLHVDDHVRQRLVHVQAVLLLGGQRPGRTRRPTRRRTGWGTSPPPRSTSPR